ncbi:hypothetical protein [Pelosinus sp. sgz500959]|uniref:hypothetical protein n=1 Tax=Pelosinus sp. sgz500959 TaxID=3242472 RepID=UPI00366EAA6A
MALILSLRAATQVQIDLILSLLKKQLNNSVPIRASTNYKDLVLEVLLQLEM